MAPLYTYKNDEKMVDPMDPKASCVGGSHHVQSAGRLAKRTTNVWTALTACCDLILTSRPIMDTHTHMYVYIYICNICICILCFYFFPLQMSFHVVSAISRCFHCSTPGLWHLPGSRCDGHRLLEQPVPLIQCVKHWTNDLHHLI